MFIMYTPFLNPPEFNIQYSTSGIKPQLGHIHKRRKIPLYRRDAMSCRMGDLRNKEVINVKDGTRIGFVSDVEIDTRSAALTAVVVYGRLRLFGLLGREPDFVIPWKDISLIGDDTVLVDYQPPEDRKKEGALARFFEKISF